MKNIELLSPVGEWDSLVAAVQNGANAVYFGANEFNARMNTKNFNREELKNAIEYAKLRNVKTNLTLNILIKNTEFKSAMELVKYAYECGIDAIIVQDLGLAREIIKTFPELEVHSSTQMTIYNLEGVKQIENLGFKRCVLSRELNIDEIEYICKNSSIDIEVFIHGALCISYSGQCLMSSLIGGRSGNRGKCAGTCRLPYSLLKNKEIIEKGYLLSSKDICTLDILPELINAGVRSFKIEGRMKSPEYVGLVTAIYRKYIDLVNSGKPYIVEDEDREKLLQIFNRGGFSTGFLNGKLGKNMMYKYKPNHIGVFIGKVLHYNSKKGYVKIKLNKELNIGDSVSIKDSSCKCSELMIGNNNIKSAKVGQIVTIGRIKGDIYGGDKVYKTVDINLNNSINKISKKENIKRDILCKIKFVKNEPIILKFKDVLSGIEVEKIGLIPDNAKNSGLTKKRITEQLSKLGNTIFKISNIDICLEENLITSIREINILRREAINELEEKIKQTFIRKNKTIKNYENNKNYTCSNNLEVCICLNNVSDKIDYEKIVDVDYLYIPLRFFLNSNLYNVIKNICNKFNTYLLMPTIYKSNYEKMDLEEIFKKYNLKGVVVSNLSQVQIFEDYNKIANYTLNVTNNNTIKELKNLGIIKYTVSPEFEKETIRNLTNIKKEIIVYGRTLLMTTEYCIIGTNNDCTGACTKARFYLKDRMGFEFPIYTDRVNCNNLIYNSKITSISWKDLNASSIRIDILDENIDEINNIIEVHKSGDRLEGKDYTNGNLLREI